MFSLFRDKSSIDKIKIQNLRLTLYCYKDLLVFNVSQNPINRSTGYEIVRFFRNHGKFVEIRRSFVFEIYHLSSFRVVKSNFTKIINKSKAN